MLFSLLSLTTRAQWVQTNGPEGGFVTSIAYDDSFIYAGTYGGGIFRSSNNGQNWIAANKGLDPNTNVQTLHFLNGKLFAGLDFGAIVSSSRGTNWEGSTALLSQAIQFGHYLISGAYRSTDSGTTWTEDSTLKSFVVYSFAPLGPNLFAGTSGGMYVSSDSGNSWSILNTGLITPERIFAFNGDLFVGTHVNGIYRSLDSGKSWEPDNEGLPDETNIGMLTFGGPNIYMLTNERGVFQSTDTGMTWQAKNNGFTQVEDIVSLQFDRGILIAGSGRGVFVSSDSGNNWRLSNSGLIATQISAFTQIGSFIFAGTNSGIFRSTDDGENWEISNYGIPDVTINALSSLGSELFVGTDNEVYRSMDSGATWSPADSGLPLYSRNIYALTVKAPLLFAGTYDSGVYVSSNNGLSWIPANTNLSNQQIRNLAVMENNIFASTPYGQIGDIARSTNNGVSWMNASSGFPNYQVTGFAENATDAFVAAFDEVFKSTDSGGNWTLASNGIPNGLLTRDLRSMNGWLFLSGEPFGVYSSSNNGNSWNYAGTGIDTNTMLTVLLPAKTNLLVGTQGTGVWRRPLSDFGISSVAQTKANISSVDIFPNPSSTTLTITSDNIRRIRIYDLLGTARFDEEYLDAASPTLDVSGLPPGVYAVEVTTPSGTNVQRMVKE